MRAAKTIPAIAERLDLDLVEKFLVASFMALLASRLVPTALATGLAADRDAARLREHRRPLHPAAPPDPRDFAPARAIGRSAWPGRCCRLLAVEPEGAPVAGLALSAALMAHRLPAPALGEAHLAAQLRRRRRQSRRQGERPLPAGIRHPMYAGYALTHIGFVLAGPAPVESRHLWRDPRHRGASHPRRGTRADALIRPIARWPRRAATACCPSFSEAFRQCPFSPNCSISVSSWSRPLSSCRSSGCFRRARGRNCCAGTGRTISSTSSPTASSSV